MKAAILLGAALLVVCCTSTAPPSHLNRARRPARKGADEFQQMIWADENGRIPPGAVARALNDAAALKKPLPDRAGVAPASWTWLGPGNIGGRITTILAHPTEPSLLWVNNPGGGIWKSTNAGATFQPVDDFMA